MRMLPRLLPLGTGTTSPSSTEQIDRTSDSPNMADHIHGRCSVCRHSQARAIAMEVLSGSSLRSVAERYGLSKSALVRHTDHLPRNLIQARTASQVADSDLLLAEIVRHEGGLKELFDQARQTMKRGEAAQLSGALVRIFDLLRKMIAEENSRTSSNPVASEETTALIGKLFKALAGC
jgi:hypothetical protein